MIQRVRPAHSDEALAQIYATPHDHRIYGHGHHLRVEATKVAGQWLANHKRITSVADLSCGNGDIARSLGVPTVILGDFAAGYEHAGPIERTIDEVAKVDLFVLSETLEHLDDPAGVIVDIRTTSEWLLLTTPVEAWNDTNGEHYWAWDRAGVEAMLDHAGWAPYFYMMVDSRPFGEPYQYGIWVFH